MGELIDLASYRERQEDNEIKGLQAELNRLIEDMGGIDVAPMMITSGHPEFDSLYVLNNPSMWYNFEYLSQDINDGK
jgi:hypothetical protein